MAPSFDDPQPPAWQPEPLELPLDLPRRPDPAADDEAPRSDRHERIIILDEPDEDDQSEPERHPGVIVVDLC